MDNLFCFVALSTRTSSPLTAAFATRPKASAALWIPVAEIFILPSSAVEDLSSWRSCQAEARQPTGSHASRSGKLSACSLLGHRCRSARSLKADSPLQSTIRSHCSTSHCKGTSSKSQLDAWLLALVPKTQQSGAQPACLAIGSSDRSKSCRTTDDGLPRLRLQRQ